MPRFIGSAIRAAARLFRRKPKGRKAPMRRRKSKVARLTGHLTVKKTVINSRLGQAANSTSFGNDTFELNDFPQYLTYIALYEMYRIDKIVYSFKALNNVAAVPASSAGFVSTLGMIHSNIDYTDNVNPTSIQAMMNDNTYKGTPSNRAHTRTFRPKFLNDVGGAVADQSKVGWLNCYSSDGVTVSTVSHYGLKFAFEGGVASAAMTSFYVEPIVTIYMSFKDPK